jgi:hypothetical protein
MRENVRSVAAVLALYASLAMLPVAALGEDEAVEKAAPEEVAPKVERPKNLDRPTGLKRYFLSPPPERLSPGDEQRARDYRSDIEGEIKRLERRGGEHRDRRDFDRMQSLQRERERIGPIIRR